MSKWNNNNLACLKTWIHLKVLDQLNVVFKDAGTLKMNRLMFWNQFASSKLRSISAKTICIQLDNMFRLHDKAIYEENSNRETAIESMYSIMTNKNNTIATLAFNIDNNYKFRGETENDALA